MFYIVGLNYYHIRDIIESNAKMKIWIVDSSTGTTFFYHQFGEIEVEVNEHLVSGLLAALNQFIMTQFEEPIESIDMGGARWIYVYDKEKEILCVAAETNVPRSLSL